MPHMTDPRFINNDHLTFLLITLKVQDIHYLFSKSVLFTFFAILFFEVPMWSTHFSHPKVASLRKKLYQKGVKSESNEGRFFRNFTVIGID